MGRNSVSRDRGYAFENDMVRQINRNSGWQAFRLGGTAVELPDILAIHNRHKTIQVYELKSGQDGNLYVRASQVQRCIDWCDRLAAYDFRHVILSFRFHSRGRNGRRKKAEYNFEYPYHGAADVKCNYNGECRARRESTGGWVRLPPAASSITDFGGRAGPHKVCGHADCNGA